MSKALDTAILALKLEQEQRFNPKAAQRLFVAHMIAKDALKLMRLSASLRGIHVHECNGTAPKCQECAGTGYGVGHLSHIECNRCDGTGHYSPREHKLVKAITETLAPYGLTWTHNTDPRGSAVGILFPDGSHNTLGGREEGWRI